MSSNSLQNSQQKHRSTCPLAIGLDFIGDRWTLLLIRDFMFFGEREYGQLLNSKEGISTNILADRLDRLLEAGLLTKQPHPSHGRKVIYRLTKQGYKLAPAVVELLVWSADTFGNEGVPETVRKRFKSDKKALIDQMKNGKPLFS